MALNIKITKTQQSWSKYNINFFAIKFYMMHKMLLKVLVKHDRFVPKYLCLYFHEMI